jgi:c-di-GMP-binding flagellar brake protein YcgR
MYIGAPGLLHDHDDPMLITGRLAIASLLRSLKERKALVGVHIHGSSQTAITAILDVDDAHDVFIIDSTRDAQLNKRIADADDIRFESAIDGIELKFSGAFATPCQHEGKAALCLALPKSLRRMQRRESYRVEVPVTQPARCTLTPAPQEGHDSAAITLDLHDISLGGVALIDNLKQLQVARGDIFANCHIVLPEAGSITATLRVMRFADATLENGKAVRQVGCAFINLPNSMATTVQRYVGLLERKLSARRYGAG